VRVCEVTSITSYYDNKIRIYHYKLRWWVSLTFWWCHTLLAKILYHLQTGCQPVDNITSVLHKHLTSLKILCTWSCLPYSRIFYKVQNFVKFANWGWPHKKILYQVILIFLFIYCTGQLCHMCNLKLQNVNSQVLSLEEERCLLTLPDPIPQPRVTVPVLPITVWHPAKNSNVRP